AVVGDRIGNNQAVTYADRPIERCVSVDRWQTVNRGYLVTYRYNGRDYTTVMDVHPGDTIPVNVAVSTGQPAYYAERGQYNPPVVIQRSNYVYTPPVVGSISISGSSGHDYRGHNGKNRDRGRGHGGKNGNRNSHYW